MKTFPLARVILVLTDNPLYADFWPYVANIWKNKFGVIPTLFFYGNGWEKYNLDVHGEVYHLPFVPEVSINPARDWACTWGLFYGASKFENDICITCGIDQAPLSDYFFKTISHYDFNKDYVVGLSDARPDWFFSSHHVAKGKIYKQALQIDNSWEIEVKKVFAARNNYSQIYMGGDYWGLDELHSTFLLKSSPHLKRHTGVYHQYLLPNRIDRGYQPTYDINRLKAGGYSELHAPRPFKDYKEYLQTISDNIPSYL